jgi:L-fuculose-phosphate aldolase
MKRVPREFQGAARELAEVSRAVAELGYVTSHGGNLSLRVAPDVVLLTPTGFRKADLRAEDMLAMDPEGRVVAARDGVAPSSESPLHLRIMRRRPDIRAIIHAHPPVLTGFALAGVDILSRPIHPELIIELGPAVFLPYAEPTSEALAEGFDEALQRANAFIMGNHGVVLCSPVGARRALDLLQMFESAAHSVWVARTFGRVKEIPPREIDKLDAIRITRNLPMPGPGGPQGSLRGLYTAARRRKET